MLTLTPRLTSLEMPEDPRRLWLNIEDVPVLMTAICDRAVEAPVETTVVMLVPDDSAEDTTVMIDLTLDIPTVAVDSDEDVRSQMLFSVDTCAEVEPVVALDCAVDRRVASDVTEDSRVDRDWVADSAELWAIEIELVTDSRVEALTA